MTSDTVTIYQDAAGEWRWRRQAGNGEIISTSGEGYENKTYAEKIAQELNPSTLDRAVNFVTEG